jgi:hypothetical protein
MATAGTLSLAAWGWVLAIVVAVAALIAIGVLLYKNWDTIWGGIKSIIKDVWDWIKHYWPLLFGILTGGIGLAVAEIIQHWKDIKRWAEDAWNFIVDKANWVGDQLKHIWHDIYQVANFVVGLIKGSWDWLVGFFTGLPGLMKRIAGDIWGPLFHAADFVFALIARAWNDTLGQIHFKIPGWVPGLGGDEFGFPHINLASGGIVTAPTLALIGERGPEAVVPLSGRAGGLGPAVHIENVNLHDSADIGLLLQQIHFATMAGRL